MTKARTEGGHTPPTDGAGTTPDLQDRVRALLPSLTPKRRRLARLLLDEPLSVAFLSAEELGRRAGADPATVVRFSRTLGYDGFTDLKRDLQARVPQFMTATEKLRLALDKDVSPSAGASRVFQPGKHIGHERARFFGLRIQQKGAQPLRSHANTVGGI